MSQPTVSVIVPVYKAERFLARCIDSILSQGIELELLLVDDGSPDRSGAICDEYAKNDARVKVIHQKNAGASAARNAGLEQATGDWIMFCDADDELLPNSLAQMLQEGSDADLILGGMETYKFTPRRNLLQIQRAIQRECFTLEKAAFPTDFYKFYETDNLLSSCAKLFRRALLSGQPIRFNISFVSLEDYDFVLSCLPHCKSVCSSSAIVYRWYQGESDGPYYARRSRLDYADDVIAVYEKHKATLDALQLTNGKSSWVVWKDLYGNFGNALSALWAIPTETAKEKLQKLKRIKAVLKTPAYRSYLAFSRGEHTKKEYRYMKHPTLLSLFLLRRERARLGK